MDTLSGKLWNKDFVALLLIDATMQFGMYLTRPIISSFAVALGASIAIAGFLAGLNATTAMLMRPASGIVSDILSKKSLLVSSCGLFALSSFGYSLCEDAFLLGFFCVIQGIAFALRSSVVISLIALVVPKQKLATGVGWIGVSYTIAGALGPAAGSMLTSNYGFDAAFIMSSGLFAVGFILSILFKSPKGAQGHRVMESSPSRTKIPFKELFYAPAVPLSIIAALVMVSQGTVNSFIILLGQDWILENAELYFLVYSLVVMGSKPISGNICDKHGLNVVAIPGMAVAAIGMATLAFFHSTSTVVVSAALMGIGQASAYSAMQAEAVRNVPEDKMGRAASTFYIGPDIGMGIGPMFSGWIWQQMGAQSMFLFTVFCLIAADALFIIRWIRISKRPS